MAKMKQQQFCHNVKSAQVTLPLCVCVCTQLLNNGHHRVTAVRRYVSAVRDNHVYLITHVRHGLAILIVLNFAGVPRGEANDDRRCDSKTSE